VLTCFFSLIDRITYLADLETEGENSVEEDTLSHKVYLQSQLDVSGPDGYTNPTHHAGIVGTH